MLTPAPSPTYDVFAVAAPGLAPLIAEEVREIGVTGETTEAAGVAFRTDAAGLYRANLQLRIASRVLVRAASFRAAHFSELEKGSLVVPWSRWIAAGSRVLVRVTARKSRLYHSDAVAQRVLEAITRTVTDVTAGDATEEDGEGNAQLVVVRIERDQCVVSLDSSGALLHRRGYRHDVAKAPLRETLAAAMLRAAKWDPATPLVDPFCGSGTIPIEAAMMARRIPPGLHRSFAFEQWPEFERAVWNQLREGLQQSVRTKGAAPIVGSDRDAGAIGAARANATRARVEEDVEFVQRAVSLATPPAGATGLLIANPPYGERIGEVAALRDLYATFGKLSRGPFVGWKVALVAANADLVRHTGLGLRPHLNCSNGGIKIAIYTAPGEKVTLPS